MNLFFIAEIGINHNGSVEIAKQLIDMAVSAGCDAVKFQKRTIDKVYSQEMLNSPRTSPWGATQREQKEALEFGLEEYREIDLYCKKNKIGWFASAWDLDSQRFLQQFDCRYNKVASAMLTHVPLLDSITDEGKHTFISTGMSNYNQIDRAINIFEKKRCAYTLMHAVSTYPCRDEDCNINVITALKERYRCSVGYSGHEVGILPSVLAVSLGAEAIERHITLDRAMYGSDQAASLERRGLELLVRDGQAVASILGDGVKRVLYGELKIEEKLRYFREEVWCEEFA